MLVVHTFSRFRHVALFALLAADVACDRAEADAPAPGQAKAAPAVVEIAEVERRSLPDMVEVSASLEPALRATLMPEVGGVIRSVAKERGDPVKEGEKLVRISASDYSLALEQARSGASGAEAGLAQAEANFDNATQQYERYKGLRDEDAVTKAEFEAVEAAYRSATAAVEAARSRIRAAKTGIRGAKRRVADTVLRAPFDGFVVARHADPGEAVRPMGTPVLEVINTDTVYAVAGLAELESPRVRVGMTAKVLVDALPDMRFEGEIVMVGHEVDARTRTVPIRVRLENAEHTLKAGLSGRIRIELGQIDGPAVPRVALINRQGRRARVFVYKDGVVQEREVEVDPRFNEYIPVLDGLEAGERVVTWGQARLQDGLAVEVSNTTEAPPGKSIAELTPSHSASTNDL